MRKLARDRERSIGMLADPAMVYRKLPKGARPDDVFRLFGRGLVKNHSSGVLILSSGKRDELKN